MPTLYIKFYVSSGAETTDAKYVVGHSPSLARYIVVFSATLLHPVFFVVMGFRKNFPSMLAAYVVSAFARSLMSGRCYVCLRAASINNILPSNNVCDGTHAQPELNTRLTYVFGRNYFCTCSSRKALGYMYGFWCKSTNSCFIWQSGDLHSPPAIGSMCSPLVCQTIIAHGVAWNHFYFGSLVLSAISSIFAFFAFRPMKHELESEGAAILASSNGQTPQDVKSPNTISASADEANIGELKKHTQEGHGLYLFSRSSHEILS